MKKIELTTKETVTLDDITNSSHVGFINSIRNYKSYIIAQDEDKFAAVGIDEGDGICNMYFEYTRDMATLKDVLLSLIVGDNIGEAYIFDTRKDLYKWLAE